MSEEFLTGDPHLGHINVIKHDGRPFSCIEEHDQYIIDEWNKVVTPKSTVRILGDFAWKNHNRYLSALKGKKILIIGTHDKMPQDVYRNFTAVVGTPRRPGILEVMLCGHWFVLSHYALVSWNGKSQGGLHCYGHSHGRIPELEFKRCCDVGVTVWQFAPVPVEVIIPKLMVRDHKSGLRSPDELQENVNKLALENQGWREKYAHDHG